MSLTPSASHTDRGERDVEGAGIGVVDGLEAERAGQHEGEPADRLLVAPHRRQQRVGIAGARDRRRQVEGGDDVAVVGDGLGVDALERAGERSREHQADRDRLAVQQLVAPHRFERVPERVPEVERGPEAGALLRVGGDDVGLDRGTRRDELGEDVEVARDDDGGVLPLTIVATRAPSGMSAYLATSPSPARNSRGGSVASVATSA